MSTCIKCGVQLVPDAVYCHICGKKQVTASRKALKRPNGSGTVYKLGGRRSRPWVAAKDGVYIGYYERKTDALAALDRLAGRPLEEKFNMTFSEVFSEWKAEHYREIGEKGVESYDRAYAVCAPLHNKKFRDLRTKDFQAIIDSNMAKSNSTLSKYKQIMTQMARWAVREEIATTDFAKYVKLPQQVKKEKAIFTDDEIALLEKDGSDAAKIALMMIYTGMRIGELFSLPLKDYHESYVIGGEKTKAGRDRVIPIRPEGRKYFAYFCKDGFFFFYLLCPATMGSASPPITANVTSIRCWKSSVSQSTRHTPHATPSQHGREMQASSRRFCRRSSVTQASPPRRIFISMQTRKSSSPPLNLQVICK